MIEKLLNRLDGVKSNGHGKYLAKCPAHNDKNPSLALKEVDGRVLVKCWSGCPTESVLSAVGLTFADLFPEKIPDPHAPKIFPPKFYKSELFEPLLNAAMVLLIGANTAAGNPLQQTQFFKQPLTEADFVRMVQAMNVIENIFMETKAK